MRRWMFLFALTTVLAGCSGRHDGLNDKAAPAAPAAAVAEARVEHKRAASVAYEHTIAMEVPAGHTRQVAEAVQKACAALPERGCTLVGASIRGGDLGGATVRMRVVPDGVNKVLASLDGRGKLMAQSIDSEDLAEPVQDGERKLAMLAGYRDQLQALARQRALDPEALIKLHRELAEVQSEIDTASTSHAQLRRRIDTELVTVTLLEEGKAEQAGKVREAMDEFGADFLRGVAGLITFVASAIPFVLAGAVVHLVWRRVRRGRRAAPSSPDKR